MSSNADAPRAQLSSVVKLMDQVKELEYDQELPEARKQQLVSRQRRAKSCARNMARVRIV